MVLPSEAIKLLTCIIKIYSLPACHTSKKCITKTLLQKAILLQKLCKFKLKHRFLNSFGQSIKRFPLLQARETCFTRSVTQADIFSLEQYHPPLSSRDIPPYQMTSIAPLISLPFNNENISSGPLLSTGNNSMQHLREHGGPI